MEGLKRDGMLKAPSQAIRYILTIGYDDHLKTDYDNYTDRREDIEQLAN